MTDETRILRTAGIPIVIAIILLVMLPKMCARAVMVAKARQGVTDTTGTGESKPAEAHSGGGLRIESSQKPVSAPADFPPGLDSERIRYLVEVDARFSAPYTVRVAKKAGIGADPADQRIIRLLQKLGYVDLAGDGTLTLTHDGLLHLDGLVEDASSWSFPVAKRQFVSVTSIDSSGTAANAGFSWKWEGNTLGTELLTLPNRHDARAEFASVNERWSLTRIAGLDSDLN
jgi:hypothetical protein